MIVIDAEKHIAGRLATTVAHQLLKGETIVIVNAEKAVITGDRYAIYEKYKSKRDRGYTHSGPFYPRRADLILKRMVRGMLPWDHPIGKMAYKRLKIYVGVPVEFAEAKMEKIASATKLNTEKYIFVGEVAEFLGSKVR